MDQHPAASRIAHTPRRRARRAGAAVALTASAVAASLVGAADPAGAIVTVSTSGTTVTATVTGNTTLSISCTGGLTTVGGQTGAPAVSCASLTSLTVNGDSAPQIVDARVLDGPAFAAKPVVVANLGDGADQLYETTRADTIDLGGGNDNLYLTRGVANTKADLGAGTDTARFSGVEGPEEFTVSSTNTSATYSHLVGSQVLAGIVTNAEAFSVGTLGGDDTVDLSGITLASSIDDAEIFAGEGNDVVRGPQSKGFLSGGAGNNQIVGGPSSDNISSEGNGDTINGGGGGDFVFDRRSPQSGRTIANVGGGNRYDLEVGWGDTQARLRPRVGGYSITSSLTRPGQQALPFSFSKMVVDLGVSAAGDARGLVDVVAVDTDGFVNVRGDSADNDLLDVTIPTGSWTVGGNLATTYTITPSSPDLAPITANDFGQVRVHGPWTNKNAGFVHRATRDLMYRFAANDTIANVALALGGGETTRPAVVDDLMDSDEYRGLDVDRTFVKYLRRQSDPAGRTYWINSIASGKALWRFRAQLFGSNEYFTKAGGTNAAYVAKAYEDVLNRKPDPSGVAYWTNKLNNGANRGSVALQFINSPESRRRVVDDQFLRFLLRKPTSAEQTTWVNALPGATGEQDLIRFLVTSNEYYQGS